ncbi:putative membrane protein [Halorubrum sp. AJ67]|nr:putative membrane protein [Halorubrum sp. AJ67]
MRMSYQTGTAETSVGFGVVVLLIGAALWGLQFAFGVFAGWGWALAVGSAWMVLGVLLLFPDVRLYTGTRSPAETYHESVDD